MASRINIASLGWIGMAIAVTFLQIFVGVLRWREIGAECGAPLALRQAMRFNVIGTLFNQTLPSSIGGDAVQLWLVARTGAGWRAATYSTSSIAPSARSRFRSSSSPACRGAIV